MTRANGQSVAAVELAGEPTPGRCIYCDQRCDCTAIYHAYCFELNEGALSPTLLARRVRPDCGDPSPEGMRQTGPGCDASPEKRGGCGREED